MMVIIPGRPGPAPAGVSQGVARITRMSVDHIIAGVQNRDLEAFESGFGSFVQALEQGSVSPDQVAADAVRLAEVLRFVPWGIGSQLAQLVGGLADFGA